MIKLKPMSEPPGHRETVLLKHIKQTHPRQPAFYDPENEMWREENLDPINEENFQHYFDPISHTYELPKPPLPEIKDHPIYGKCWLDMNTSPNSKYSVIAHYSDKPKISHISGYYHTEREAIEAHNHLMDFFAVPQTRAAS